MRRIVLAIATLFALTSLSAQQLLMEGGKKTAGATSGQVLKWNGTTWAPAADDAGAGVDETWGKGSYSSPTFSGKTITDAVFRRGKISLFTADTTGRMTVFFNDTTATTPFIHMNGNAEIMLSVAPDSRSTIGTNMNLVRKYGSSGDGNQNNQILSLGFNNTPGGGREDNSKPSIRYVIEENFRNGPTNFNAFETHLPDIYYTNGVNRRPISGYYTRDGANLRGFTGFTSDYLVFTDYKNNSLKATLAFRSPSPYALGLRFADSSAIYLGKNNFGGFLQKNAANSADVRIAMVNSSDQILLGGQNESMVAAYNHLRVTNGGLISNENNDINIGDDSNPTRLNVKSNDGAGFTLRRVGGSHAVTHGLFGSQYYFTNPATGITPYRWDISAPEYTIWARSTGKVGIGEPNPTGWLHVNTSLGATAATFATTNTTGTNSFFRTGTTPAGAISANPGDMALSGAGELYGKYSGTGTTSGWGKYLNLIDPNSASTDQFLKWNGSSWGPASVPQLPTGTSGQTLRHDGTNWVANSVLFNNGTNIGIGTTTPGQKLDVNGSIRGTSHWSNAVGNHTALGSSVSGTTSWQIDNVSNNLWFYNGTAYSMALENGTGNMGLGNTSPSDRLHVTGNLRVTGSIKDGNNEAGTSGQFLKSTGSSTDWVNVAPSDLSQAAATSGQVLKWNGTIWAPATDNGTTYTVGAFSTTGNADAISVSGSTLTAHAATATTPGSVSLADGQVLGDGGKVIQNNLNGETTALTLRNSSAAGADAGPGLVFQAGSGNANMFQVQSDMTSGATTTGAQTYLLNRNSSNSISTHVTLQPNRTTQINGFFGEEIREIATTLDASANFWNRYPHYCFTAAAASLTLPLATNVVDGTRIQITSLLSSGTACTVNTAAAYAEFMFDYDLDAVTGGNQFFGANLSVASGQSFVLSKVSISGTGYWKVVSASAGASLQALSNSSTSTTHQVSLTSNGGSLQLSEGTNISLTTTGTVADGIVTITGAELRAESFTATASQTTFSTSAPAYSAPSGNRMPFTVERNGVPLVYVASGPNFKQFTYSGSTITTSACDANDVVVVKYLTN